MMIEFPIPWANVNAANELVRSIETAWIDNNAVLMVRPNEDGGTTVLLIGGVEQAICQKPEFVISRLGLKSQ
jgi:hypothetical protein